MILLTILTSNIISTFSLLIVILLFGLLYFIPSIVAILNKKNNSAAIIILNLLLGWTFIGWVIAIVWAFTQDTNTKDIIISHNSNPETSKTNLLEKLKNLLDNDIITQEDYEIKKNKILSK